MTQIILASTSPFRLKMLRDAGLTVEAVPSDIDERAIDSTLENTGVTPAEVANILAEAKAVSVSENYPDAVVIGADQTLSLGDQIFHKPADMEGARRHLLALSGKTHELNSAVVIARAGVPVWRTVSVAHMTMRKLEPAFIGRHLSHVGDKALQSVGAYQVEGAGIQLFETIEGDYFTIVGLPLLPLLSALREQGAIDG
ncbi:Maf-like protein [Tianweitania sp. BSSL-BM11]|uniref:7-methyl-GTP pyrophosphatase n=1 Tax=Tianweitania aestuarii TaxID=2814886 RepID=A0ABS5RX92_9HYPH|nr:Maf-like protein [Tianweitania aestuarii]MBS9721639.1 Maf-like protein [Tianweitania aestuarii]